MTLPDGPLVAWYGDDFTGSAAVMEVLTFAGFPSALFFDLPTPERLARFPGLRGIGVAGDARARSPAWMAEHLPPVFAALRALGTPILHYKICSTLDSAPHLGSIGAAADVAMAPDEWAPMIVAAPEIGRWQAFGTLFAAAGAEVHRLDRHPTMSVHPATPMDEADVRRHLARQTARRIGLVDLRALKAGGGAEALAAERRNGRSIVALDVVDEETLATAGALVWEHAAARARQSEPAMALAGDPPASDHSSEAPEKARPLFVIGSQGIEYALVAAWRATGDAPAAGAPPRGRPVERLAVVSGSCSPVTAEQIRQAERAGFETIRLNPCAVLDAVAWEKARGRAVAAALAAIGDGRDPIVCTALGPDDAAVGEFRAALAQAGEAADVANGRLGAGLGAVLREIVEIADLTRAAIAGGDTSSAAAGALGLWAVSAEAALAPGAALLKGHGDGPTDGIEIALKGGQMGTPSFFQELKAGGPGGNA